MRDVYKIPISNYQTFQEGILAWGNDLFDHVIYLNSNRYYNNDGSQKHHTYESIIGIGCIAEYKHKPSENFDGLLKFSQQNNDWLLGYLGYDLKNEIEKLESKNIDKSGFPVIHFIVPKYLFIQKGSDIYLHIHHKENIDSLIETVLEYASNSKPNTPSSIQLKTRFSKDEYLSAVIDLKKHIKRGDIYEVNFCQEFYALHQIDPLNIYLRLTQLSPTPFSSYYKLNDKYLLSASPERYLKKNGSTVISQPIKGTAKRGQNTTEDREIVDALKNDPKERAENIMIVDLVRNDLSRTAKKGTVKVTELCGIYTFPQVHQMISTITSELRDDNTFVDVIKATFPMGSMTGAPKIRAMELIEDFERTKRGIYSGAVGYITPENDFDFSVVIRSITYNAENRYLSFIVGGAITHLSVPEKEYEECLLKAKAMLKVLSPESN